MAETRKVNKIYYIYLNDQIKLADGTLIPVSSQDEDKLETAIIEHYLRIDDIRARVGEYNRSILNDPNNGHWDLWELLYAQDLLEEDSESDYEELEIKGDLYARNPKGDVNLAGVVGIDFGTKSTVVVKQDSGKVIIPISVGLAQRKAQLSDDDNENPTILQFLNIPEFENVYQKANPQLGRPNTNSAKQLEVSSFAVSNLAGATTDDEETAPKKYNQFITDLKQWTKNKQDTRKMTRFYDNKTKISQVWDMKPYITLLDTDLDPVEAYAYALGMHINNMKSCKIYFDYYLSFPVNYEYVVRDKIQLSFERGLKKSLPSSLLRDEDIMSHFHVRNGGSEPAAYAVSALEEYGFEPEENEKFYYGVFDFGGGTTDFDFGLWREADENTEMDYDYVIEHFGGNGDANLGGENLLALLAFELFKINKNKLFEKRIKFLRPTFCNDFANSDQFISNGAKANLNTKTLTEILRPFWYNNGKFPEDILEEAEDGLKEIECKLYPEDDSLPVLLKLFEDDDIEERLKAILVEKIQKGVDNFFDEMRLSFNDYKDFTVTTENPLNIFLAGNSSKSGILIDLLNAKMDKVNTDISNRFEEPIEGNRFKVFPPLGSTEAEIIITNNNPDLKARSTTDFTRPTGKTGVAYGLIKKRDGSPIREINHNYSQEVNNIKFKYFVGKERKKKFSVILSPEDGYNNWKALKLTAKEKTREIRYSSEASSTSKADINTITARKIELPITDETSKLFIRAIDASIFEFTAGSDLESVENGDCLFTPIQVDLDKRDVL